MPSEANHRSFLFKFSETEQISWEKVTTMIPVNEAVFSSKQLREKPGRSFAHRKVREC